jgi:hypothetical protein
VFIEPAADAASLQGIVQPLGKGLVLMAAADEAGKELKWLVPKRRQVTNEFLRQPAAAQKHSRQWPGCHQSVVTATSHRHWFQFAIPSFSRFKCSAFAIRFELVT